MGAFSRAHDQPGGRREDRTERAVSRPDLSGRIERALVGYAGDSAPALYPGAVAAVARRDAVDARVAVGHAQVYDGAQRLPSPRLMSTDTLFDIASVTKVVATTASLMTLVGEGAVNVDATARSFLPELPAQDGGHITLRHLLTHSAGLWEWWPLYVEAASARDAIGTVCNLPLRYEVGGGRHYSDLGMMLLGEIVSRVAEERLDSYARRRIFEPLGMTDTTFRPAPVLRDKIAATSVGNPYERNLLATNEPYPTNHRPDEFRAWRHHTLVGEPNDGNAHHAFDGVAGHAGLFSTADDLLTFGRMLLALGRGAGSSVLDPQVVEDFVNHGWGFWTDRRADFDQGRGGYGHSGFTGCELFVDPGRDITVVFLSNRCHRPFPYAPIRPAFKELLRLASAERD